VEAYLKRDRLGCRPLRKRCLGYTLAAKGYDMNDSLDVLGHVGSGGLKA
jgi:hypothetical protein